MAGGICHRIGTTRRCDFRRWKLLPQKACGFRTTIPCRSADHRAPACLPVNTRSENGMWRGPGQQPLGSPGYRGIKRDVKMLSEHLAEAGYQTGAFGKWHMGALDGEVPNDRGFDEFRGFLAGAHPYWITEGRSKFMHNRQPDRKPPKGTRPSCSPGGLKNSFEPAPPRRCSFLLLPRLQRRARSARVDEVEAKRPPRPRPG